MPFSARLPAGSPQGGCVAGQNDFSICRRRECRLSCCIFYCTSVYIKTGKKAKPKIYCAIGVTTMKNRIIAIIEIIISYCKSTKNWVLYGIFWACAPYWAMRVCQKIVGYKISLPDIASDYILLIFAVSVNLLSNKTDFSDVFSKSTNLGIRFIKAVASIFAIGGMIFFGTVYLSLYTGFASAEILEMLASPDSGLRSVLYIATVCLVIDGLLGAILKMVEHYNNRNNTANDSAEQKEGANR